MKNTRTTSYVMTVHTESAGDMLELKTLRKTISIVNKHAKDNEKWSKIKFERGYSVKQPIKLPRYYVKCQARGLRTKFAKALGRHPRAFDQSLPLKFAEKMDVYVYQR
jgi:hypothetical protein